jgi:hypothetical protein
MVEWAIALVSGDTIISPVAPGHNGSGRSFVWLAIARQAAIGIADFTETSKRRFFSGQRPLADKLILTYTSAIDE